MSAGKFSNIQKLILLMLNVTSAFKHNIKLSEKVLFKQIRIYINEIIKVKERL